MANMANKVQIFFNTFLAALIDYMHCCKFKWTFSLLINSKNSSEPYYLGFKLKEIDKILSNIKYSQYPTVQRPKKFKQTN